MVVKGGSIDSFGGRNRRILAIRDESLIVVWGQGWEGRKPEGDPVGHHRSAFLASDIATSQKGPGNLCVEASTASKA